jgi:hypothetical protein
VVRFKLQTFILGENQDRLDRYEEEIEQLKSRVLEGQTVEADLRERFVLFTYSIMIVSFVADIHGLHTGCMIQRSVYSHTTRRAGCSLSASSG